MASSSRSAPHGTAASSGKKAALGAVNEDENTKETPLSESAMLRMKTRLFSIAGKSLQRRYCLCFQSRQGLGSSHLPLNYSRTPSKFVPGTQ